jgi:hypothetical protein
MRHSIYHIILKIHPTENPQKLPQLNFYQWGVGLEGVGEGSRAGSADLREEAPTYARKRRPTRGSADLPPFQPSSPFLPN